MFTTAPDIAGARVGTSVDTGEFEKNVFGCTVQCTGAGQYRVITDKVFTDVERRRVWTQRLNANIAADISVVSVSSNTFTVLCSTMSVDDPDIVLTPATFAFCFGVSEIPG